jgi:hypothetical protein
MVTVLILINGLMLKVMYIMSNIILKLIKELNVLLIKKQVKCS